MIQDEAAIRTDKLTYFNYGKAIAGIYSVNIDIDDFKQKYPNEDIVQFPPDYLEIYATICKRLKTDVIISFLEILIM